MFSLPHLLGEDVRALDAALDDFLARSGANAALVIDPGGFLVAQCGKLDGLDTATLGALAANSFAATRAMAELIRETGISSVYQEGAENSALILSIKDYGFLVVIFPAAIGVGSVKYYTGAVVERLAEQFAKAHERAPGEGLDLAALNFADPAPVFQRR